MKKTLAGQVAVVTGANTGIGKETARGLAERGATVVLACRNLERAEAARADIVATTENRDVTVAAIDLGDAASIRSFATELRARHARLDVLVHNAGVWNRERRITKDGHEATFGTNHLGTFLLNHELEPLLRKSAPARVVVVASTLHYRGSMAWGDVMSERRYSGLRAYNQSKLANVMFTKALARRLEGSGVTVNAVHPGGVATEITRDLPKWLDRIYNAFLLTPAQGARTSLHVATSDECATVSGAYFEKCRAKPASRAACDERAQERLWRLSEELLGLATSTTGGATALAS